MATQTKVIGPISAYAIAVQEGYTGSKSEWAAEIGNAQENAQIAQEAANRAQSLTESLPEEYDDVLANFAPVYSQRAFAVGDYTIHNGELYCCNTQIASGEAWNDSHWTRVNTGDELKNIVKVAQTQPSNPITKLWINSGESSEVQIPTTAEMNEQYGNVFEYAYNAFQLSVKYTEDVNKTDAQKAQARANINAASADDLNDVKSALNYKPDGFKNLYNSDDEDIEVGGYYSAANEWQNESLFMETGYIPVEEGMPYRANTWTDGIQPTIVYFDSGKQFLSGARPVLANGYVIPPTNAAYIRIAILAANRYTFSFCQSTIKPPAGLPYNTAGVCYDDTFITDGYKLQNLSWYASRSGLMKPDGTITGSTGKVLKYRNFPSVVYLNGSSGLSSLYSYIWFVANGARVSSREGSGTWDNVLINVPAGTEEIWIYDKTNEHTNDLRIKSYTDQIARYQISDLSDRADEIDNHIDSVEQQIAEAVSLGAQWQGKVWYAYGTSLTNINSEGKYPTYLAQMSGMNLVCKGISGGGIGNFGATSHGQVYNAICNTTDGKLNADIITLETGANDISDDVPLGTIFDTGTSTLAGCLNDCIQYLQANTTAQICVFASPIGKQSTTKMAQWAEMIRQICDYNRVTFLSTSFNIGKARANSSQASLYYVDNVHQTDLGGYCLGAYLWYQIRNIPLFFTAIPQ